MLANAKLSHSFTAAAMAKCAAEATDGLRLHLSAFPEPEQGSADPNTTLGMAGDEDREVEADADQTARSAYNEAAYQKEMKKWRERRVHPRFPALRGPLIHDDCHLVIPTSWAGSEL